MSSFFAGRCYAFSRLLTQILAFSFIPLGKKESRNNDRSAVQAAAYNDARTIHQKISQIILITDLKQEI
jgi:hypothetical protein